MPVRGEAMTVLPAPVTVRANAPSSMGVLIVNVPAFEPMETSVVKRLMTDATELLPPRLIIVPALFGPVPKRVRVLLAGRVRPPAAGNPMAPPELTTTELLLPSAEALPGTKIPALIVVVPL